MIDEMRDSSDKEYRQLAGITISLDQYDGDNPGKLDTITDDLIERRVIKTLKPARKS